MSQVTTTYREIAATVTDTASLRQAAKDMTKLSYRTSRKTLAYEAYQTGIPRDEAEAAITEGFIDAADEALR